MPLVFWLARPQLDFLFSVSLYHTLKTESNRRRQEPC